MNRIVLAGTASGCGKTTITLAILKALTDRGIKVHPFKCGPDYIDPMYHRYITGQISYNLDYWLMDEKGIRDCLERSSDELLACSGEDDSCDHSIDNRGTAIIEGVMGYYDGRGMKDEGSTHHIAAITESPVVLIINCKGMSRSILAQLKGYLDYGGDGLIKGIIFNRLPASLYPFMKNWCYENDLLPLGYMPDNSDIAIGSRHLGLILPGQEEADLSILGALGEKYIDLDKLLLLSCHSTCSDAATASVAEVTASPTNQISPSDMTDKQFSFPAVKKTVSISPDTSISTEAGENIKIAVAMDEAFCFYYEDNLRLLRRAGAETVFFSPLRDEKLPDGINGIYLGGGYPELYGKELEANRAIRSDIKDSICYGMPVYAECGGYIYLHSRIRNPEGDYYDMTCAIEGDCIFTERLQRFGYVTMRSLEDNLICSGGEIIRAHEFHRCISEAEGTWDGAVEKTSGERYSPVFSVEKNGKTYRSHIASHNMLAGFPHLHFAGCPSVAENIVKGCRIYKFKKG